MEIIPLALITLAASAVGTLAGFGISTVMVPVLVMFLPLKEALLLVAVVHWFGNLWKVGLFRRGLDLRLILAFGLPAIPMTWLAAGVAASGQDNMSRVLGAFLIVYVIYLYLKPSFRAPRSTAWSAAGGAGYGFAAGLFGIGGAVRSAFLAAYDLPKEVYICVSGAIGLVADTSRIAGYLTFGFDLPGDMWRALVILVPASFAGAWLAKRLADRIPQKAFRKIIAAFLLLAGVRLLIAA